MTNHRLGDALIREHHEIDAGIEQFAAALDEGGWEPALLASAFDALRALRAACQELLASLDQHNTKEEPVAYPHAATDLTPEETTLLEEFIEPGRTPSGWACEGVR